MVGGRGAKAAGLLAQAGYATVCNLIGGFGGMVDPAGNVLAPSWRMLGYPACCGEEQATTYEQARRRAAEAGAITPSP